MVEEESLDDGNDPFENSVGQAGFVVADASGCGWLRRVGVACTRCRNSAFVFVAGLAFVFVILDFFAMSVPRLRYDLVLKSQQFGRPQLQSICPFPKVRKTLFKEP